MNKNFPENALVAKNEAVVGRCIDEAVRSVHEAQRGGLNPALSAEEIEKAAMPVLLNDPDYMAALSIRFALSWLGERTRWASSIVVGKTPVDWQVPLLKKEGLLADVATVEDIAANCDRVGFIAKEATPELVAAVEKLRVGFHPHEDEMAVLPALIVPGIPNGHLYYPHIPCD